MIARRLKLTKQPQRVNHPYRPKNDLNRLHSGKTICIIAEHFVRSWAKYTEYESRLRYEGSRNPTVIR